MSRWSERQVPSPTAPQPSLAAADGSDTPGDTTSQVHGGCSIVMAKLPNGGEMALEVPTGDDIGNRVATTSRPYEAVELRIVDAFLPRNPAIIDVGANIGNHAIYWALTHRANVTAFEPFATAEILLNANVTRNAVGHLVTAHGEALGAGPGQATPEPRMGNLGATRMRTDPYGPVDVVTLDTFHATPCDLLKVDVEGGELAVLQGASELLDTLRPLVWVEVLTAADRAAIRDLMRDHRYRTFLMLSPTNAIFLPHGRRILRLLVSPRAMLGYLRRSIGRAARSLRATNKAKAALRRRSAATKPRISLRPEGHMQHGAPPNRSGSTNRRPRQRQRNVPIAPDSTGCACSSAAALRRCLSSNDSRP